MIRGRQRIRGRWRGARWITAPDRGRFRSAALGSLEAKDGVLRKPWRRALLLLPTPQRRGSEAAGAASGCKWRTCICVCICCRVETMARQSMHETSRARVEARQG